MAEEVPTRQRLLAEGMRLFAERGFAATTVGDVEAAAGLQPRRGALYKHFASKEDLLRAAVDVHLDAIAMSAAQLRRLDLGDLTAAEPELLRPIVSELGRWFLAELDRQRDMTHVLEHDGARLPDVMADVHADVIDTGNQAAGDLLAAVAPGAKDPQALAVLLLGSLVALRRTAWTFGAPPLGLDDERALASWTDLTLAAVGPFLPQSSQSRRRQGGSTGQRR